MISCRGLYPHSGSLFPYPPFWDLPRPLALDPRLAGIYTARQTDVLEPSLLADGCGKGPRLNWGSSDIDVDDVDLCQMIPNSGATSMGQYQIPKSKISWPAKIVWWSVRFQSTNRHSNHTARGICTHLFWYFACMYPNTSPHVSNALDSNILVLFWIWNQPVPSQSWLPPNWLAIHEDGLVVYWCGSNIKWPVLCESIGIPNSDIIPVLYARIKKHQGEDENAEPGASMPASGFFRIHGWENITHSPPKYHT